MAGLDCIRLMTCSKQQREGKKEKVCFLARGITKKRRKLLSMCDTAICEGEDRRRIKGAD